jgi:hypothetical protein
LWLSGSWTAPGKRGWYQGGFRYALGDTRSRRGQDYLASEGGGHKQGCLAAVKAGWRILKEGGDAVDAAEAAVRVLEDDPPFNAGTGLVPNAVDGTAEAIA